MSKVVRDTESVDLQGVSARMEEASEHQKERQKAPVVRRAQRGSIADVI